MKLLAIDTSSEACSVALRVDVHLTEQHVVGEREHTAILAPMIRRLLGDAGLAVSDLDAIVLGNGPGSFIGMRIGASVAQGLCFGAGLKLVPVSSLAAVAAEAMELHDAGHVLVAQDARMQEVYVGRFRRGEDGLPVAAGDEDIQPIGALRGFERDYLAAGGAWAKYPDLLAANRKRVSEVVGIDLPRARYVLACGARAWRDGAAIAPDALTPSYIRVKVAEEPPSVT